MNRPANSAPLNRKPQFTSAVLVFAAFTLCANTIVAQTPTTNATKSTAHPARRIVVSFPDHKLALLEGDRVIKTYDVAVGASITPSPSGEFQIAQRLANPNYYRPGVVIGPGANNPLGPRWIGLNVKGFGIHGTNRPDSVGKNASHGCIRLRNHDIEDLFARVQVGDRVSLIAERTDETARLFGPAILPNAETHETLQASNVVPAAHEPQSEQQGDR
ncbi:MAG TPA: L,D-transpeptidase [Verrucomicrobiae bacterium]|nr:L,D-transpeptidase [Verrucomicrobiae bacterium]